MAPQPNQNSASPGASPATGPTGPGRPRSIISSASSGSLRGVPIEIASALASSSSISQPTFSSSPPVASRSTASSSSHHHHYSSSHAHSGHGNHSAHIVRAKPAVRSSNPGWRASVCGPSASATVAAASQGLDSPSLARDGGMGQTASSSYVYGYSGMHQAPASPALSARTSLSSASVAPGGAASGGATSAGAGAGSGPSVSATGATGGGGPSTIAPRFSAGTASESSAAALNAAASSAASPAPGQGPDGHQYSALSGTSRQSIAMAAFKWDSLPVSSSMTSGNSSGSGGSGGAGGAVTGAPLSTVKGDRTSMTSQHSQLSHPLGLGLDSQTHDLISSDRQMSSLGLDEPPTEGMMDEIPVLSPPYGEFGLDEDMVSPRGGTEAMFSAGPGMSPAKTPEQPTGMQQVLHRRFAQEIRGRNLSESLRPGASFAGNQSADGGLVGSSVGAEQGTGGKPVATRQSFSGVVGDDAIDQLSPHSGMSPSNPSGAAMPERGPSIDGGKRMSKSSSRSGGLSLSRDAPSFRAPPPLRLVPALATPPIAGAGHEGRYDWANFVFAYSRGKWDPHRLPRPPGQSTLHPGVKTRITQSPGVVSTPGVVTEFGPERAGVPGAFRTGGVTFVGSSSGHASSSRQRQGGGGGDGSLRSAAPELSISPATPLDAVPQAASGADDEELGEEIDPELLARRRPSLTYVADSSPDLTGPDASRGTQNRSAPSKPVSAEEAAARVAVASQTAQALLREREEAEREAAASGGHGASSGFNRVSEGNELAVGMPEDVSGFACQTEFTSPFTSVAIRNMLEGAAGTGVPVQVGAPPPSIEQDSYPVPLSPAASAPGEGTFSPVDTLSAAASPSESNNSLSTGYRNLALNAALGTHVNSQRSNTYGGSGKKFDPLVYENVSRTPPRMLGDSERHASTGRADLDRSTGGRDRPTKSGLESPKGVTHSMPAATEPELWESDSIGLSKRSQDAVRQRNQAADPEEVIETDKTPAHPGGFVLDEAAQQKVEEIAEQDYVEQLAQSSRSVVGVDDTVKRRDFAAAAVSPGAAGLSVPQRPKPTPVQTSPEQSSDGPHGDKSPGTADGQRSSSTRSIHSASGSSSTGSFHNPPLHRRRRPSPTTSKGTPPGSAGLGGFSRSSQRLPGVASSSSSPSASVRALGLGAVVAGTNSSRGSPVGADGTGGADEGLVDIDLDRRGSSKTVMAFTRSNSSPSVQRVSKNPMGIEDGVEYASEYGDSAVIDSPAAPSCSSEEQKRVMFPEPTTRKASEALQIRKPSHQKAEGSSSAGTADTMQRFASHSGSPAPQSPHDSGDSAASSFDSAASGKRKKRPGSSGGMHHSLKGSPYVSIPGGNIASGWGTSALDSSTVAELRMAASRRKSLETHPILALASVSGVQSQGPESESRDGEDKVGGSGSKVNLNLAKQSGAALSLSGKLPLSAANSVGAGTAGGNAAAALGMLKLQLSHSLSFPPDQEVRELWAKQADPGDDPKALIRKEKKSSSSSKRSGRAHQSETIVYTLKSETQQDNGESWQVADEVTAKRTIKHVEPEHQQKESKVQPANSERSQKPAETVAGSTSPFSRSTRSGSTGPTPPLLPAAESLAPPVRSSSASPSSPTRERETALVLPASPHELPPDSPTPGASTAANREIWNACTLPCGDDSFATTRFDKDGALKGRPNLSPSGSTAMNAYLTAGGRAEAFYIQNGYLPAIMPPNELERRQALKRYGPPKLAGNVHFDRIAHLVKLVFNTKLVLVSLVGEKEQIFQTESGGGGGVTLQVLQRLARSRDCSFCAHAILQDGDEPVVILDASRDWRFAGNPLVLGSPHIRFYAGSPLRTTDGFNIGSLCIIDDQPWTEFSPRQRHTLKEFARVVMREMELLRDRIQLGLRDSMQRSIESFTRECVEMDLEGTSQPPPKVDETKSAEGSSSTVPTIGIHRVYDIAARAMKDALQVSGAVLFDLSHLELLDTITRADVDDTDGQNSVFFPGPLHSAEFGGAHSISPPASSTRSREMSLQSDNATTLFPDTMRRSSDESILYRIQQQQSRLVPPMAILGSSESLPAPETREDPVPLSHHVKVAEFLRVHRAGRYFPFIPLPFRHLLPDGMSNLMMVPVFGLNKQPFAMLCAYSEEHETGPSLDELKESGLQYLRAIGMIVLSAVLKKDIVLADKAKSHFISNISHELRTPLHGILAAAELLTETKLNSTQGSYLETVEACGKSLLELVNHVLDFTKLSGNSRSQMARHNEKTKCDLVRLIQEVCESSWIGSIAKSLENKHSGIGSVYAPPQGLDQSDETPKKSISGVAKMRETGVETVIDISMRETGWMVQCDAGGIRRVLMNLIGNSLKFTTAGFVHVSLREIQSTDTHVVIELGVTDTGRGISRSFLEEQLFHPFTQENPLGTGTGLGLSIVNSIVQSPALNGKIDVWSTEGQGTEIRVTCELELSDSSGGEGNVYRPALKVDRKYTISLLSFGNTRGEEDLKEVVKSYLADWWDFEIIDEPNIDVLPDQLGDLVLMNEDTVALQKMTLRGGTLPPVIVLTSSRGDATITNACEAYHAAGGVARLLFKPAGPAKLEAVLDFCLQCLERIRRGDPPNPEETDPATPLPSPGPSPRESPVWRPMLEQQRSYFGPTADPITGTDIAKQRKDQFGATPTGDDLTPGSWDDLTPKPPRDTTTLLSSSSSSLQHQHNKDAPHISPQPPNEAATSNLLIRRHSIESKVAHHHTSDAVLTISSTAAGGAGKKISRPLLPARSITYHEPRLHKHVLMSPHQAMRRQEGQDYFGSVSGAAAGAGTPPSERVGAGDSGGSLPSSPGSTISLEGGEGAVLKTALQSSSSASSASSSSRTSSVSGGGGGERGGGKMSRKLKILSVEDNPINRRVIQAFLAKMNIEYVEATDGMQGVKAFAAHPPQYFDVILMDLSMPVLDGIGATAAIRRIELDREKAAASSAPSTNSSSSNTSTSLSQTSTTSSSSTTTTTSTTAAAAAIATTAASVNATAAAAIAASNSGPPLRLPHPRTRVKIFALTGRSTDEDKRKAFATGADGYIVKPLSFKVLSSLLKMLAR
ncbi:unnamed protein product [Tilletia controversa]|uniref:histidine kinase n=1 Tax=Tilletia controversa TaxID=13291 RepID=A0A8X7MWU2_9BASI|nr:hypothetical protein CF328_g2089 [Tilletia controversa]KAE8252844.1 hypothetical protein A4X06_0g1886 [Tilletia controversa]CAD6920288.1 unnamed protein product [Tilletia controversa]